MGEVVQGIVLWLLVLFLIGLIAVAVVDTCLNYDNEITEGIVIDKEICGVYETKYRLKIQGEKDGDIVEYRFYVTPQTYDAYNIGDYYSETR